jgi:hypothetical protein
MSECRVTPIKLRNFCHPDENPYVIPTKVGIQIFQSIMDSCFRRNDAHLMAVKRVGWIRRVFLRRHPPNANMIHASDSRVCNGFIVAHQN